MIGKVRESRQRRCAVPHKWQRRTEHRSVDTCKVWERVIERKDLGWADKGEVPWVGNISDGLCRQEDFEIDSQRVEHQDDPNKGESETKDYEGKDW